MTTGGGGRQRIMWFLSIVLPQILFCPLFRHSREGGNPEASVCEPKDSCRHRRGIKLDSACTGMTTGGGGIESEALRFFGILPPQPEFPNQQTIFHRNHERTGSLTIFCSCLVPEACVCVWTLIDVRFFPDRPYSRGAFNERR